MSYEDRMATASFRGFDFLTDDHNAKGGRRLAVTPIPGSDEPHVKDLGGKPWDWKLNAYFIGPDYDLEKNGFLEKLNQPGADWLLHPWLGSLWVRAQDWSIAESNERGGMATVSIDFVPGGKQPYVVQVDKVDVAIDRTAKLADAAVDDFELEPMSADGMTAFLANVNQQLEGLRNVISMATLPLTWAGQAMNLVQGVKGDIAALMAIPDQYAAMLRSLTNALGGGGAELDDTERPRVVARFASIATTATIPALTGLAATDGAVQRNLARESALRGQLMVAATAQAAMADYRAEADRDAALATAVSALDWLLPTAPDSVFEAAVDARTSLIDALMAQDLKPSIERNIVHPMPVSVLAYLLDVDEDVFIARNAVRHPMFVQGEVYG